MIQSLIAIFFCLSLCLKSQAHIINQIAGEFDINANHWTYDLTFDIGFSSGDWTDPDEPQKPRSFLLKLSPEESVQLQVNTADFVRSLIEFPGTDYQITFPDYDTSPPSFPKILTDGAYLTVRLTGLLDHQQALSLKVAAGKWPNVIVINQTRATDKITTIFPGDSLLLVSPIENDPGFHASWLGWIKLGFFHVIPTTFGGMDHLLFIMALSLVAFHWRAILTQSLVFTFAHMVTLGLVPAGVISPPGRWVEILIAASIVFMALDSLSSRKHLGLARYAGVLGFGLIHGLGFGSSLGAYLHGSPNFLGTLALMNLGVELGQITVVLATLSLCFFLKKHHWPQVRRILALLIAAGGMVMLIDRL